MVCFGTAAIGLDNQLNVGMHQLSGILKFCHLMLSLVLSLNEERMAEDKAWVQGSR